jgi:glutamine---fructose-6-phosphate transaminase (isomerizing)
MCGIIGFTGKQQAKPILLEGLRQLEYRGYDSAGYALGGNESATHIRRIAGSVQDLVTATLDDQGSEQYGIAHTRWATHGAPNETNAHPHKAGGITLVHNGIVENYSELKAKLEAQGVRFLSQTDTEVYAQLLEEKRTAIIESRSVDWTNASTQEKESIVIEALRACAKEVDGHYAVLFLVDGVNDTLFGLQEGAPLVATEADGSAYIASDLQALLRYRSEMTFIPKGKVLIAASGHLRLFDATTGLPESLKFEKIEWTAEKVEKEGYETFMLKEVFQQPMVVADTLSGRLPAHELSGFIWDNLDAHTTLWKNVKRLQLVACGTSYHAAMVAKYYFERWARLDTQVDIASEYRYRSPVFEPGTVVGVISQSGETADTLAALRLANDSGASTFSICNVPTSTIVRESGFQYPTKAGPEIGVASTKAFTGQLTILCALALDVGRLRGVSSDGDASFQGLARLPHDCDQILQNAQKWIDIGSKLSTKKMILFVGRGTLFPVALEGALKMKELTYMPAEGFAAGELKHGPIAYLDPDVAVIVLAPKDELYAKSMSNLEEIKSRGAMLVGIGTDGDTKLKETSSEFIGLPTCSPGTLPILAAIPLQLISYGAAKALGRNIDRPRNLAKSVTVE